MGGKYGFTSDFHLNADTLISYHDEQSAPLPEIAKVVRGGDRERGGDQGKNIFPDATYFLKIVLLEETQKLSITTNGEKTCFPSILSFCCLF